MTSSTAAPADPTDVVGARGWAFALDSLIGLVLLPLALLVGSYQFYERTAPPEGQSAVDTCNAFNIVDDPDTPEVESAPRVDAQGRSTEDTLCVPFDGDVIYVDVLAAFGAYAKFYAITLVIGLINPVVIQGFTGASIGKHALGLRVVRADGQRAGFGWVTLRYLIFLVEGWLIGLILMLVTQGHRRLGDMAAGTYVVRKESMGAPIIVPPKPGAVPYGYDPGYGVPQPGWGYPPAAAPLGAPTTDGPHWDPERGAYIRYDRDQQAWLQWSEAQQRWGDIDT